MRPLVCPGCLYSSHPHFQGCENASAVIAWSWEPTPEEQKKKHLSDVEFVNQNARGK